MPGKSPSRSGKAPALPMALAEPDAAPKKKAPLKKKKGATGKKKQAAPATKEALLKRCAVLKEQIRRHPEQKDLPLQLEAARAQLTAVECGAWSIVRLTLLDELWRVVALSSVHNEVADMHFGFRAALRNHESSRTESEPEAKTKTVVRVNIGPEGADAKNRGLPLAQFSFPAPGFLFGRSYGALHCAALCGDGAIVARLLKEPQDAYAHTQHGSTALHMACLFVEHPGHQEAALLLSKRLPQELVDARNPYGETALLLAVQAGAPKICKLLIGRGASVCEDALLCGVGQGDVDISACLLKATPEDTIADMAGALLCRVAEAAATDCIAFHAFSEIMDLLTGQFGVDINSRVPDSQETCMHAACREQSVSPIAVDLFRRGADPRALDSLGRCPVELLTRLEKESLRDMFCFHMWTDPS